MYDYFNTNPIENFLKKNSAEFTKSDLIEYIMKNEIRMINFRYIGGDGRLKSLNFIINSLEHLDQILTLGERVDGSSLFSSIGAKSSDLYVIPKYRTAFINPFTDLPSLDIICEFYTTEMKPFSQSPHHVVEKAHNLLTKKTGLTFQAMGELEYYLFSEKDEIYTVNEQKGYHESRPFSKWALVRKEAMDALCKMGAKIKYGHSEVGNIIEKNIQMVQHEIEFLPVNVEEAANQLVLAKWVVREVAYKYNLEVSFAPKIMVGQAGSGLHVHTRLMKNNKNAIVNKNGELNETGLKLIAGLLKVAPSLTAFGNTVPTSYLRLVPHQEAPTKICWGSKNRSVLVRVPLSQHGVKILNKRLNPKEPTNNIEYTSNQTVELRSGDGSANVHYYLAGITLGVLAGLTDDDSLDVAKKLFASEDVSNNITFNQLPASCYESAQILKKNKNFFIKDNVFLEPHINQVIKTLEDYKDKDMSEKLAGNHEQLDAIVKKHIHCG